MASDQDTPNPQEAAESTPAGHAAADSALEPQAGGAAPRAPRKRATRRAAAPASAPAPAADAPAEAPVEAALPGTPQADGTAPPARAPRKRASRAKTAAPAESTPPPEDSAPEAAPAPRKRATRKRATTPPPAPASEIPTDEDAPASALVVAALTEEEAQALLEEGAALAAAAAEAEADGQTPAAVSTFGLLFQAPDPAAAPALRRRRATAPQQAAPEVEEIPEETVEPVLADDSGEDGTDTDTEPDGDGGRRRRRRGGKGRRRAVPGDDSTDATSDDGESTPDGDDDTDEGDARADAPGDEDAAAPSGRRRTRRRRRSGSAGEGDDPPGTVTRVREARRDRDEATGIKGSTRLEAKKQRRREGREAGRRRTIITEAEFLARRESVERVMVVRQEGERTQIGVLEDGVLVEHYVSRADSAQSGSMAGNVYLGRVQNVLPSMEAAFVDIGKGRNAVLYAGEVNWDAAGLEGQPKRIELALKSGDPILVQVTKDPVGQKGARLTSQVSLPGRYLVYVPEGRMTGISRKLPDTERTRLKKILKEVVPPDAGVIVRTAAEGASEAELRADVERLAKIWEGIQRKAATGNAPVLLHGEVDLTVRVIRDVFNEDFASMVVSGDDAWATVNDYIGSVAPDLAPKLTKWTGTGDIFAEHRIDEQLAKAMDRKVWLPSGGSLVIDRTEAMTVIDVNTGKFVGAGGNLEETVTKNNIEAAEEIVRQLRLRDIGGIIVIDFIDMVLESNRDLVVRRLLECLGRDRTKHQVAEVTSLGLVQMTRKRVGAGLIEVFSEPCEHCNGRGIIVSTTPVDRPQTQAPDAGGGRRRRGRNGSTGSGGSGAGGPGGAGSGSGSGGSGSGGAASSAAEPAKPQGPTPAQIAAAAYAALHHDRKPSDEVDATAEAGPEGLGGSGAVLGWPEGGESHRAAGEATGLGWPDGDDAPALPLAMSPDAPAPEAEAPTRARGRRRRGRVSAPAGPPRRAEDGSAPGVDEVSGADTGEAPA